MANTTYKFNVGDIVRIRRDAFSKIDDDLGSLITWFLLQDNDPTFVVTKVDTRYPDTPYLLNKFFCETHFKAKELIAVNNRPCTLPIGTKVKINKAKLDTIGILGDLLEWFRLFGNDDDVFTIVGYSDTYATPYILDRYMGEVSFFENELIPV